MSIAAIQVQKQHARKSNNIKDIIDKCGEITKKKSKFEPAHGHQKYSTFVSDDNNSTPYMTKKRFV